MKKVKRFLIALLCVCALAALTAIAASAYGEQEAHIILDDTPQIGRTAPKKASSYIISDFVVKKVDWVGELDSGKFKANTEYTALITLTLRDSSKSIDPDNFVAYVNNQLIKTAYQEVDTEVIVPVEFEAITPVEEIRITLTAPVTGKTPATTAKLPSGAEYEVKKVEWKGTLSNGKFKENTEYTANVTLGIKSGANAGFDDKDFPVYINDQLIDSFIWNSGAEIVVPAVFSKTAAATTMPTSIKKVEITVTPPETGKTPATTATVPSSADYTVKKVEWKGTLSSGKFKENTSYTANVTLGIKSGKNAVFADKNFEAYVNGYLIDEITWKSGTEIVVPAVFEKTSSATTTLKKVEITLTPPETGKTPATTATVPSGADYTVKKVEWKGTLSNGKFKENTLYTADVTLGIKSGKNAVFADKNFEAYVNGYLIDEITWKSGTEIVVPAVFGKTLSATTLKKAEITLTAPETGKTPATTAKVPSNADYIVKKVEWTGSLSSGKFKENTSYTAYITLGIKSGKNAVFSDVTFDADVNGYIIDEIRWVSPAEIIVPVEFEKTPAPAPTIPATGTAYPSTQTVDIDGKKVSFQMYALRDAKGNPTNYIKVRDLALALTGTKAQFDVGWNGSVNLVAGKSYAATGTENSTPFSGNHPYKLPSNPTNVNGSASDLVAIYLADSKGGGYTYYQLRDLGQKLGFNVGYASGKGVFIETGKPYTDVD